MRTCPTTDFVASPTAAIDNDQGILHFDYNLTPRDALSFVYVINDERDNLSLPNHQRRFHRRRFSPRFRFH